MKEAAGFEQQRETRERAKAKACSWEEPGVGAGSEQGGVKRQAVE